MFSVAPASCRKFWRFTKMHRAGKMPALPKHFADRASLSIGMRRFQRIVANRAAHRDSRMNRGSPALQAVVPGAMKDVGDADRSCRSRHLDPRKKRMIIHNGVRQENFIDAAAAEIECRSVVQGAPRANAREQPIVLAIPKIVNPWRKWIDGRDGLGRFLSVRGSGAANRLRCGRRVRVLAFGRWLLRPDRGHSRKQEKCTSHRAPHPIPHRKTFGPFVSHIGSTDCGQGPKGCKAGKQISTGNSSPIGRSVQRR